MNQVKGSRLNPEMQDKAKREFIHRYTKTHKPQWANRSDCRNCPPQFADDNDWLEHTLFWVTKTGKLDERKRDCYSTPTWPDNPELRNK